MSAVLWPVAIASGANLRLRRQLARRVDRHQRDDRRRHRGERAREEAARPAHDDVHRDPGERRPGRAARERVIERGGEERDRRRACHASRPVVARGTGEVPAEDHAEPGEQAERVPIVERVREAARLQLADAADQVRHRARQERHRAHSEDPGGERIRHPAHPARREREAPEEREREQVGEHADVLGNRPRRRIRPFRRREHPCREAAERDDGDQHAGAHALERPPADRDAQRDQERELRRHQRRRAREVAAALEREVDREERGQERGGDQGCHGRGVPGGPIIAWHPPTNAPRSVPRAREAGQPLKRMKKK